MKKIISVLCIVAIALQFMLCAFAVDNDGSDTEMSLTLEKYTDSVLGVVYTTKPVTIEAVYDNGNTGASYLGERDNFIKKSWFRVETLDSEADLNEIYNENKSR